MYEIYMHMYICVYQYMHMVWLRSVGSIKLQVSFAEYRLFYRSLLQQRPIILSILLTKATPYKLRECRVKRGGGLGSRPKKMYGERLGDGVEYHLMSPTPRC